MSVFATLDGLPVQRLREGLRARSLHGELLTLTVFEVDPHGEVPAHRHPNEQLGLLLRGSVVYRIGEETHELHAGGAWHAASEVDHHLVAGPEGAVFLEVFAPPRTEWRELPEDPPEPMR
jgi:quercetin dioxygenase-like cupin family protein